MSNRPILNQMLDNGYELPAAKATSDGVMRQLSSQVSDLKTMVINLEIQLKQQQEQIDALMQGLKPDTDKRKVSTMPVHSQITQMK